LGVRADDSGMSAMLKLSAFADEISPVLDEQVRVCRDNGVTHIELRSVDNQNVLEFSPATRKEIRSKLSDNGLGVICIGSPIGKVKVTDPFDAHLDRFKIALDAAAYFGAPLIRIFSYYPPEEGGDMRPHRDEVLRRMGAKVDLVRDLPVTLVHENEVRIYGEKGRQCLDLMQAIDSPKLRSAFDFANFVQAGEHPRDNWPLLKPYTIHLHIKDAKMGTGRVVPAGQGDGEIEAILVDAYRGGYRGFLSLEPHLAKHEQFSGFSGPELFKVAVDALKELCRRNGINEV
jgi:sugar phosphate isomerase/epimerase